jgi:hypothetical protein
MATRPSPGSLLWGAALNTWLDVGHNSDGTNKVANTGIRGGTFEVPNLAAGSDYTKRTLFGSFYAFTMTRIGILTHGVPAGIDDSNTVVLTIKNSADVTVVTKTFNLANQPPTNAFADLGTLVIASFTSNDYLYLTVTQGTTANLPAFAIVVE